MSDLLHLLSWIQTATSAKSILRTGAWLVAVVMLWMLRTSGSSGARWLGFVGVDVALYFGVVTFFQAPIEWIKYLFVNMIFLALSASRIAIKLILIGLAALLSLIYFISPIDFIPDILLGFGWIDDALVAFGLICYAARSNYTLPVPSISAEDAATHPTWKIACVVTVSTCLTGLLRAATG
jgi:uncharacterized membrane protein YkvA (DUF1232 family)